MLSIHSNNFSNINTSNIDTIIVPDKLLQMFTDLSEDHRTHLYYHYYLYYVS